MDTKLHQGCSENCPLSLAVKREAEDAARVEPWIEMVDASQMSETDPVKIKSWDFFTLCRIFFDKEHEVGREYKYRKGFFHGFYYAVEVVAELKRKGLLRPQEIANIMGDFCMGELFKWKAQYERDRERRKDWDHYHPILKQETWWKIRDSVFDVYGKTCILCGSGDNVQIDHIEPVWSGGLPVYENLRPLCKKCNLGRNKEAA
jgi:hypothetical protein